jgi:hypothetical protein
MTEVRLTLAEVAARLAGPAADPGALRRRRDALLTAVHGGRLPAIKGGPAANAPWLVRPADLDAYARLPRRVGWPPTPARAEGPSALAYRQQFEGVRAYRCRACGHRWRVEPLAVRPGDRRWAWPAVAACPACGAA